MKRYTTLALSYILLASSINVHASPSNTLIKADYLYSHLAYNEAISYYEELAARGSDPVLYAKLGDCYRLTKNPAKAAEAYENALKQKGYPEDVNLHYAQALMNLGKYEQAAPYLKQYQVQNPGDRRVANMIASCNKADEMRNAMPNGGAYFLSLNTDYGEFGPSLRRGELFFTSDVATRSMEKKDAWTGTPYYKIYSTKCTETGNCNEQVEMLQGNINTKYHDGPCAFSADGKTMFFTRTNYVQKFLTRSAVPGSNDVVHLQILTATDYDQESNKYKKITPFKYNSDDYSTAHPTVSADGSVMVFASNMPGGEGGIDLYMCKKEGSSWSKPMNLGKNINTEGDEMFPTISKDNTLYFASNGLVGFGGLDIYKASWNNAAVAYAKPENMGAPLNSSYDDMSLVLNESGEKGYFASDRPSQKKGDNIYAFNNSNIFLSVKVIDANSGQPIPNAVVALQSTPDKRNLSSDNTGDVFTQIYPEATYSIVASHVGYNSGETVVSSSKISRNDTLAATVKLTSDFHINYNVVVLEQDTKIPVADPDLIVMRKGALPDTIPLNTGQVYATDLEPEKTYSIYAVKQNYYSSEKFISTEGIKPGMGNNTFADTIFMKKLKVGEVYKIENIYYDYNKANVREDAKPSLNRLLELLNQYPTMRIQVNSHTDCRGTNAYNAKLSGARATSVIKYLEQRGVKQNRLISKGFGESLPVEKCSVCEQCTEEQHQANRRTEFQILEM